MKREKKKSILEIFLTRYSRLKIWYICKERLRDVYKAKNRQEAKQLLESLNESSPQQAAGKTPKRDFNHENK